MSQEPRKLKLREKVSPYFELALSYVQYLGLINQIDLDWPDFWATFLQWASISTLAAQFNLTGGSTSAVLDARAHFLALTVLLPLGLSFVMLIYAKPIQIIGWFFALLLGVGLLVAGVALVLLGVSGNGETLAKIGGGCIGACILVFGVWYMVRRSRWRRKELQLKQVMREARDRARTEAAAVAERAAAEATSAAVDDARAKLEDLSRDEASCDSGSTDSPAPARNSGSLKPLVPKGNLSFETSDSRGITHRVLDQEKEEEKEAFKDAEYYKDRHTRRKSCLYVLFRLLLIGVFIFAAVVVYGYLELVPDTVATSTFFSLRNIFGPILLILGILLFVYLIVNSTQKGRVRVAALKSFLEGRFIWLMLFSLTLLYIPFTTTALGAMRCVTLDCQQGYQPPVARVLMLNSVIAAPTYSKLSNGCDLCKFANNCSISASLCAPSTSNRLTMDLSQPCSSNLPWMIPVALISALAITLGTPLLFYRLVVKHTRLLENIPAYGDVHEQWELRCRTTRNSAKMLYQGFTYKWRFYRMLLVLQRLALSIFTIYLFQQPVLLIYLTLIIHFLFFLFNLTVRPYRNLGVDGLAFGTGGGLVATCAFGVAISTDKVLASGAAIIVIALDIAFPTLTTSLMMYCYNRKLARKVAPNVESGGETAEDRKKKPLDVVDIIINAFTLRTMSNFFMLVGGVAFIGLAVGIVGIVYSNSQIGVVGPVLSLNQGAQQQFAGYTSWSEFTQNCCCLSSTDTKMETWKCANGYFKERLRQTTGYGWTSGLGIRGYCEVDFSSAVCAIPSSNTNFQAGLCVGSGISDYAAQYLW